MYFKLLHIVVFRMLTYKMRHFLFRNIPLAYQLVLEATLVIIKKFTIAVAQINAIASTLFIQIGIPCKINT